MKTTKTLVGVVLAMFLYSTVFAQENQLWYVHKFQVHPDKIGDFTASYKEYVKASKANKKEHAFHISRSLGPVFYQFQRVKNPNGAGMLSKEAFQILDKMDESHVSKLFESIESWHGFFIQSIDSLSYYPEDAPVMGEDLLYAEWWIQHIKNGTMSTYANTFDMAVEKNKAAGIEYPIGRFEVTLGMEKPAIFTVFWGKNQADLYAHLTKVWETLGPEVQDMINNFEETNRKSSRIQFWVQPELSYQPE
jgi:hypothetical protein